MNKRIVIIQGHPDAGAEHFCHALAREYSRCATAAGHAVRVKSLKLNILEFCGISPIRTSLVWTVESDAMGHREEWLARVAMLA